MVQTSAKSEIRQRVKAKPFLEDIDVNPGTLQFLGIKSTTIQSDDADFNLGLQQAASQHRELSLGSGLIECWNDVSDSD